jgi:hypothetical protein
MEAGFEGDTSYSNLVTRRPQCCTIAGTGTFALIQNNVRQPHAVKDLKDVFIYHLVFEHSALEMDLRGNKLCIYSACCTYLMRGNFHWTMVRFLLWKFKVATLYSCVAFHSIDHKSLEGQDTSYVFACKSRRGL